MIDTNFTEISNVSRCIIMNTRSFHVMYFCYTSNIEGISG